MPKREHEDPNDSPVPRKTLRTSSAVVDAKIHYAKQLLFRALKLGKAFERQKLSRREKNAKKEQKRVDLNRILDEIEAIKTLDLQKLSGVHVNKTILKQKTLREALGPSDHGEQNAKMELSKAGANVVARLFKSAPVVKALAEGMRGVKVALGVTGEKPRTAGTKVAITGSPGQKQPSGSEEETDAHEDLDMPDAGAATADEFPGTSNGTDGDTWQEEEDQDNVSLSDWKDRLADSDEESLDLEALKASRKPTRDFSVSLSPSPNASDDPDDDDASAGDEVEELGKADLPGSASELAPHGASVNADEKDHAPLKDPQSARRAQIRTSNSGPAIKPGESAFLPSLSLAGYYSGSDSASEGEPEDLSAEFAPQRKNRRGQRARQAIWEKKYGREAKHVQNGTSKPGVKKGGGRDDGWDLKRGATDGGRGKPWERRSKKSKGGEKENANLSEMGKQRGFGVEGGEKRLNRKERRQGLQTGDTAAQKKVKKDSGSTALHPSWEAARKAKEMKEGKAEFSGRKITFD